MREPVRDLLEVLARYLFLGLLLLIIILMENYCFGSMATSSYELEEDIRILKEKCEEVYPVASLEVEPGTNNLLIKWKGGDSYGNVKEGEIYGQ